MKIFADVRIDCIALCITGAWKQKNQTVQSFWYDHKFGFVGQPKSDNRRLIMGYLLSIKVMWKWCSVQAWERMRPSNHNHLCVRSRYVVFTLQVPQSAIEMGKKRKEEKSTIKNEYQTFFFWFNWKEPLQLTVFFSYFHFIITSLSVICSLRWNSIF